MDFTKVRLDIFVDSQQGGRKYMEDFIDVRITKNSLGDIDYAYFAVFDGHGGYEAAEFAKQNLFNEIVKHKAFRSSEQDDVMKAIKEGFLSTHRLMLKVYGSWSKTNLGFPSTAGTTATVAIIKKGILYVAHVGDSTAVMGTSEQLDSIPIAHCITQDHKPTLARERKRIEENGGKVMEKAGVKRVVWKRSKPGQTGLTKRNCSIEEIPFLAVSRSLGDLWSFDADHSAFVVSPEPDLICFPLEPDRLRYLIVASDGLWNVVKHQEAITVAHQIVSQTQDDEMDFTNPAAMLTGYALSRWSCRNIRADNTSVIFVSFSPAPQTESVIESVDESSLTCIVDSYKCVNLRDNGSIFLTPENSEKDDFDVMIADAVVSIDSTAVSDDCVNTCQVIQISFSDHSHNVVEKLDTVDKHAVIDTTVDDDSSLKCNNTVRAGSAVTSLSTLPSINKLRKMHSTEKLKQPISPVTPAKSSHLLPSLSKTFISPRSSQVLHRLRTRLSLPPLSERLAECEAQSGIQQKSNTIIDKRTLSLPSISMVKKNLDNHALESLSLNPQVLDGACVGEKAVIHSSSAGLQNRCPTALRKRRSSFDKPVTFGDVKKFCVDGAINRKRVETLRSRRT